MARLGYFGFGQPNSTTPELTPLDFPSPLPDLLTGLLATVGCVVGNEGLAVGFASEGWGGMGICSSPTFCGFNFGWFTDLGTIGVFFFTGGGVTGFFFGGTTFGGAGLGGAGGSASFLGACSLTNATSISVFGFIGFSLSVGFNNSMTTQKCTNSTNTANKPTIAR